jgi:DNA sulfur modification protein DndC
MSRLQPTLFDEGRMTLIDAIDLTRQSLIAWGDTYRRWAIAYSGGKDSTALVAVIVWLIRTGLIKAPESLTVLLSDTRQELPPLFDTAMRVIAELRALGVDVRIVHPVMADRFWVYILGRGVPPPSNTFRWCTSQLKVEPMLRALAELRDQAGEKFLMLTGVRIGESAQRDQRIALSCGKNNSECGQGWFQEATPKAVADTLAPLLHWRLCHVWDWLTGLTPEGYDHGLSTKLVAEVYGQDENLETHARTGCICCDLASSDRTLEGIVARPKWAHMRPLLELRAIKDALRLPANRLRKDGTEKRKDGTLVSNPCRMGPITFEARLRTLDLVLDVQARAGVDLINTEEEAVIRKMVADKVWPNGWDGSEPLANTPFENVRPDGSVQTEMMDLLGA